MSVTKDIITVGFDKKGEADFGVSCSVFDLTIDQMKELRSMIPVAIGEMERMWSVEQTRKHENAACSAPNGQK